MSRTARHNVCIMQVTCQTYHYIHYIWHNVCIMQVTCQTYHYIHYIWHNVCIMQVTCQLTFNFLIFYVFYVLRFTFCVLRFNVSRGTLLRLAWCLHSANFVPGYGGSGMPLFFLRVHVQNCTPAHLHTCTPAHLHTYAHAHMHMRNTIYNTRGYTLTPNVMCEVCISYNRYKPPRVVKRC